MIGAENILIKHLAGDSEVDGHDAGSGEMNIFVFTDDPRKALTQIEAVLGSSDSWVDVRVAYREVGKSQFTILWPKWLAQFEVK